MNKHRARSHECYIISYNDVCTRLGCGVSVLETLHIGVFELKKEIH